MDESVEFTPGTPEAKPAPPGSAKGVSLPVAAGLAALLFGLGIVLGARLSKPSERESGAQEIIRVPIHHCEDCEKRRRDELAAKLAAQANGQPAEPEPAPPTFSPAGAGVAEG